MKENTTVYSIVEFDQALIDITLKEVSAALKEKGYNPINQIAGYLMSGDPGYISSYKDARKKMVSIDRNKILEFLVSKTLGETN